MIRRVPQILLSNFECFQMFLDFLALPDDDVDCSPMLNAYRAFLHSSMEQCSFVTTSAWISWGDLAFFSFSCITHLMLVLLWNLTLGFVLLARQTRM